MQKHVHIKKHKKHILSKRIKTRLPKIHKKEIRNDTNI